MLCPCHRVTALAKTAQTPNTMLTVVPGSVGEVEEEGMGIKVMFGTE